MTLLNNIQSLLHLWFPNKKDDKKNFNNWSNELIEYNEGILLLSPNKISQKIENNIQIECYASDGRPSSKSFYIATNKLINLIPSFYDSNQQMQIIIYDALYETNETLFNGTIASLQNLQDSLILWTRTYLSGGSIPYNAALTIYIIIDGYISNNNVYSGIRYHFTITEGTQTAGTLTYSAVEDT